MNFGSKFKIGSVLATASAAILLLSNPLYAQVKGVPEDTAAPSPLQEKALLELRVDDIIDSIDYVPTIFNADGKVENLPIRTRYYYAGDQVSEKTIIQDGDDYGNIEMLGNGVYRVYAADIFVYDPNLTGWRTIENATIDPAAFEAVMLEQIDPTLGDLLSGTFHAHAETYNAGYDCAYGAINSSSNWSAAHDSTTASWFKDCTSTSRSDSALGSMYWAGTNYAITRSFFRFDLSSLSGTVTEADFSFRVTGSGGGYPTVSLLQATAWAYDDVAGFDDIADWTDLGSTATHENTTETISLNQDGLDVLTDDLGGDADLLLVDSYDLADSAPSGRYDIGLAYSENTTVEYKPHLDLTIEEGEDPPAQSTTTITYASSTPGLSLETSIYFLFFAVVFTIGGLIIFSWFRDWFN